MNFILNLYSTKSFLRNWLSNGLYLYFAYAQDAKRIIFAAGIIPVRMCGEFAVGNTALVIERSRVVHWPWNMRISISTTSFLSLGGRNARRTDRGHRMIWTTCGLSFIAIRMRGRLATDFHQIGRADSWWWRGRIVVTNYAASFEQHSCLHRRSQREGPLYPSRR